VVEGFVAANAAREFLLADDAQGDGRYGGREERGGDADENLG
jgi:hypothetical protein